MLDNKLIESALQLTGKTMNDMTEPEFVHRTQWFPKLYHWRINWLFSIEKFCYYLLSPEFIEKYTDTINIKNWYDVSDKFLFEIQYDWNAWEFWKAVRKYQSWNEQPLIELLTKICKTTNND